MGKYSDSPQFAETQALVAALEGDEEELERLVKDMYRGERRKLADACEMVSNTVAMVNRGSNRL